MMTLNTPEDENASPMIITLRLDVRVSHQEDGQDDDNNIPPRENESRNGVGKIDLGQ